MKFIDSHIHFWQLKQNINSWIFLQANNDLKRDYLIDDITPNCPNKLLGVVHIEAHDAAIDTITEARWLEDKMQQSNIAYRHIAFIDITLAAEQFKMKVQHLKPFKNVVGIRHILSYHPKFSYSPNKTDLSINKNILYNLKHLANCGLIFDCQIYPHQLANILEAIVISQVITVIDHMLLPAWHSYNDEDCRLWQSSLKQLAQVDNVYLKLSGIDMFQAGEGVDLAVGYCLANFPIERLIYGSNYPISFNHNYNTWFDYLSRLELSSLAKEQIFIKTLIVYLDLINTMQKNSIIIASLGTIIEYYDYAIFSLFLPFFAPVFFPSSSNYAALVNGFYALLIASFARPIGGLIFGMIGDRFGRKTALIISLYGIALATLAIGLSPGYQVIGSSAVILIVLIRAVQMLCFGGEYSGAGIYVVELAKHNQRALVGSILSAMALLGSVLAAIIGMIITIANIAAPNWRLAFIVGGFMGLIAIFFRRNMTETLINRNEKQQQIGLFVILKSYPKELFAAACIGGFATLPFTTVLVFINPLLITKGYLSSFEFMQLQLFLSIFAVIVLICSGLFADKKSPLLLMRYASLALVVTAIPISLMLASNSIKLIVSAEIILIGINELLLGPSNAFLKELFPANIRYRGVAFSFCLGMSLIGGLTPVIENYLYSSFASISYISLWLSLISLVTWLALHLVRPRLVRS